MYTSIIVMLVAANVLAPGGLDGLTQHQAYSAQRESSSHPDITRNGDARPIEPGGTLVLGELEGPGMITHIWCTVGSPDILHGRNLVLRIYYDGLERPSVEAPLGDFFGVGHGALADYVSEPAATSSYGRARNCFWKMPFRERARVTVSNESDRFRTDSFYYYLDWRKMDSLPEDTPYFHARYRQAAPALPGNYTILETQGRGHYVGTVYSAHQMETGWFGEGDDFFYIDGEEEPRLRGTGTEDYFGDAWGFRKLSTPYYGVSVWEGYFPGDRVTAYRWHIHDPIPFQTSLRLEIEHRGSVFTDDARQLGSFEERSDWLSSVAYWYQTPAVGSDEPLAPAAERLAPHRFVTPQDMRVEASEESAVQMQPYQAVYAPGRPDAAIDFTFEVEEAGRYQVNAVLWHSVFGGVYQAFLDGQALGGPRDLCGSGSDPVWVSFDLHDLAPGPHTLRFEGRGPSPHMRSQIPPTYGLGLTYIVLLRLEDMAGYREALHRILEQRQ